jgi:hypothetical protein
VHCKIPLLLLVVIVSAAAAIILLIRTPYEWNLKNALALKYMVNVKEQ